MTIKVNKNYANHTATALKHKIVFIHLTIKILKTVIVETIDVYMGR